MAHGHDSAAVMKGLRSAFDGNSTFMTGHQIKRIRSLHDGRKVPAWSTDDEAVRKLLLRSFPKLATNKLQRDRAGRWMRVIQLYFRGKKSSSEVAEEIGTSRNAVKMLVSHIKLAQKGQKTNGTGKRTKKTPVLNTKEIVTPSQHLSESE